MTKRWIVLSVDGLATASIGAYGSPWNETPAMDRLASVGTVWDRVVATHDNSIDQLSQLWSKSIDGATWLQNCRDNGRLELFINGGQQANEIAKLAANFPFDQCTITESSPESVHAETPSDEIESTALAKLLLPVLERINEPSNESNQWSLLWVHSDTLTRSWDAPRWLFPIEEDEEDEEPTDQLEWSLEDFELQSVGGEKTEQSALVKPPALFEGLEVPYLALPKDTHPDLITSWMQTYGCQIRLLDHLVAILSDAIEATGEEIGIAIIGTSGFSLGQNGWIGHRAGPIRSPQIHLPVILCDGQGYGVRLPGLRNLSDVMSALVPSASRVTPEQWAIDGTDPNATVETTTDRAERVLTSNEWFFVREGDRTRLYLKPDDRDDMNDIADRCRDVVESLESVT